MKKLNKSIILILPLCALMGVVGCSSGGGNSSSAIASSSEAKSEPVSSSEAKTTSEEISSLISSIESSLPSSENTSKESISSEETTSESISSDDKKDSESSSSSQWTPKEGSVFARVNELAENVDTVPEFMDDETESNVTKKARKNTDEEHWNSIHTNVGLVTDADAHITTVKNFKNVIIDNVRMLNKWTYDSSDAYGQYFNYRVTYDYSFDEAYFEYLNIQPTFKGYSKITSKYDSKGNVVIQGYYISSSIGYNYYVSSFYYHENESMDYISKEIIYDSEINSHQYNYSLVSEDLSIPHPLLTGIGGTRSYLNNRYEFRMQKIAYQEPSEESDGVCLLNSYMINQDCPEDEIEEGVTPIEPDYKGKIYQNYIELTIPDSDGNYVLQDVAFTEDGMLSLSIDPYYMEGYTMTKNSDGTVTMTFKDGRSISSNLNHSYSN